MPPCSYRVLYYKTCYMHPILLPYAGASGAFLLRQKQQQLFRRSVAVVDAANLWSNFFLPPAQAKEVAASLMAGEFLLLTAHRQAGKKTLAQAIVADLQEGGCLTAVIMLTMLPDQRSRGIFNMILDLLQVPHRDGDDPQR